MNAYADKAQKNKRKALVATPSVMENSNRTAYKFEDNRPETIMQGQMKEMINNSPRVRQFKAYQEMVSNNPRAMQLMAIDTIQLGKKKQEGRTKKKEQKEVEDNSNARATAFGQNWIVLDWRTHIKSLNMSMAKGSGSPTESGKILFN